LRTAGEGVEVFTMNAEGADGNDVRKSVKLLTELLAAEHLKPAPAPARADQLEPLNELAKLKERCQADVSRVRVGAMEQSKPAEQGKTGPRALDDSSPVFLVDHSACILCDRCVRACDEVMGNNIIGRTGKGASAAIGFDLNDPMGMSNCVQCGECMISCPTTAITFRPVASVKITKRNRSAEVLCAETIMADPLFCSVPPKFLLWQEGLVLRQKVKTGEYLCRQGDAGNTAFLLKQGRFEVTVFGPLNSDKMSSTAPRGVDRKNPTVRFELTPDDVIVGEMACLTGMPRAADIMALEDGEVWELRRNVLDRLMRVRSLHDRFEKAYRDRVLGLVLRNSEILKGLPDNQFREIVDDIGESLTFVRLSPGQVLFRQGELVNDLYFIRLGYLRVGVRTFGTEAEVLSMGPGKTVGEIGMLALTPEHRPMTIDEVDRSVEAALVDAAGNPIDELAAGYRAATCTALSVVELARLKRSDFLKLARKFPALRRGFVQLALTILQKDADTDTMQPEFVAQGLYEGRSILVLDLDLCTRCDECTKGCVEQHGRASHGVPITRLLRDGMRFDKYLIATSCRSCAVPHCLAGCPVDAIHRGKHMQIIIEDHCIGCGLCASNCPYGSIFMVPNERGDAIARGHNKAAACDLCDAEGTRDSPDPKCVAACPHDAAFRLTGEELFQRVVRKSGKKQ
jgi:Fe-S-cluster-containing hydrogenase component 2